MASSTTSSVAPAPTFLQTWEKTIKQEYIDIMGEMEDTPHGQRAKYLNWNHYFSMIFNDKPEGQAMLEKYLEKAKALLQDVVKIAPGKAGQNKTVPDVLPAAPVPDDGGDAEPCKLHVNLWHLPFQASGSTCKLQALALAGPGWFGAGASGALATRAHTNMQDAFPGSLGHLGGSSWTPRAWMFKTMFPGARAAHDGSHIADCVAPSGSARHKLSARTKHPVGEG